MKPAGILLLVPVGLMGVASADEIPAELVSKETKAHVRAGLPTFQSKPTPDVAPGADSANADQPRSSTDPNLLLLPKLAVKERRLPPDPADHLMSPQAFNRK